MAVLKFKPAGASPIFERKNLDRLKESVDRKAKSDELIRNAKKQIERTQHLIDESVKLRHG